MRFPADLYSYRQLEKVEAEKITNVRTYIHIFYNIAAVEYSKLTAASVKS